MNFLRTVLFCVLALPALCYAHNDINESDTISSTYTPEELAVLLTDSIHGETGIISFPDQHFKLTVPEGFVFLNPDDTKHLLVDYWGNPDQSVDWLLGSLVSSDFDIYGEVEIAYPLSYFDEGYVSDEDAEDIDYDDLLKEIKKDLKDKYESDPTGSKWEIVGWAWKPNYDKVNKTLSWAKHFVIDNYKEVINYDVRILGREGYVIIRAVADPVDKDKLIDDNSDIVSSVKYDEGYRYEDFDPETDHIAEWTIGGLIAGKVLAKAGIWAIIAKFGKVIIVALLALFAAMRKRIASLFSRRNKSSETPDNDNK